MNKLYVCLFYRWWSYSTSPPSMGGVLYNSSGLPTFTLTGLPELENYQHWMFLLLGTLYIVSIVGNALILHCQGGAEFASACVLLPVPALS